MRYTEVYSDRKLEIEQALLELMQERPLAEITVTDLTARLKLVRKTFYHYYPNKTACLESMTDRLLYECDLHLMQSQPDDAPMQEYYAAQLRFWMGHRDFLNAVISNDLAAFFIGRVMAHMLREYPEMLVRLHTDRVACDEDVLLFYVSGDVSMLLKWCREGFPLSVEEMAAKKVRLLHEPLLPAWNEK